MKRKRRTKMVIETSEVYVVRRQSGSSTGWCASCEAEVAMVGAEEAAAIAGVSARTMYRWIEGQRIHFAEDSPNGLLVCLNSLSQAKRD